MKAESFDILHASHLAGASPLALIVWLLPSNLAHTGQCGAIHMVGSQDHRDPLVSGGNTVVLVPVCAASSRRGAEDGSACHTEAFRVGVPSVRELGLPLKD